MLYISKPLKIVKNDKGDIHKFLDRNSSIFDGFGEVYFSNIKNGDVKGWKVHSKITTILTVIHGNVKFVLQEYPGKFEEVYLDSANNYKYLKIPPNILYGFKGLHANESIIASVINHPHDPLESNTIDLSCIEFDW